MKKNLVDLVTEHYIRLITEEESEYQKFFRSMLAKEEKPLNKMTDEEKKNFFNKIELMWKKEKGD